MPNLYKKITVHGHPGSDSQGHVQTHVLVAEKALGKHLPPKAIIHHVDENPSNNVNSNLVICQDQAYHKLLHVRLRTLRAGGDPNISKVCKDCKQCKPFEAFNLRRSHMSTGRQSVCRLCQHDRWRKRRRDAA